MDISSLAVRMSMVLSFNYWLVGLLRRIRSHFSILFYFTGRTVSEENSSEFCELLLCGSRGVGGVATMSGEGLISMDLLDLEDDEEEDEDDDEEASY